MSTPASTAPPPPLHCLDPTGPVRFPPPRPRPPPCHNPPKATRACAPNVGRVHSPRQPCP
eukprot:scaffold141681_cov274-Phaeocystis_antarctica.AAC.1